MAGVYLVLRSFAGVVVFCRDHRLVAEMGHLMDRCGILAGFFWVFCGFCGFGGGWHEGVGEGVE